MNSEIRVIGPKTKVYLTIGLSLSLVLIVSMFLFPDVWRLGLYALGFGLFAIGSGKMAIQGYIAKHNISMMALERDKQRYMPVARTDHLVNIQSGKLIIAASKQQDRIVKAEYKQIEQSKSALSLINEGYHFMMIGDTGSGKSTLAGHFINHIGLSNTIICDPHATFNEWPKGVKVVQDYESIAGMLSRIVNLMDKRYKSGNAGNLVLLAIDELPKIIDVLNELGYDAGKWIRHLSREGRKVNIRLLIMSQGENVGDLGQKGYSSVKLNFIKILLSKHSTKKNFAKAIYSNGDNEQITLHGPLQIDGKASILSLPSPIKKGGLNDKQIAIIKRMKARGDSLRSISQAVWGSGKIGSYYNEQIESVSK